MQPLPDEVNLRSKPGAEQISRLWKLANDFVFKLRSLPITERINGGGFFTRRLCCAKTMSLVWSSFEHAKNGSETQVMSSSIKVLSLCVVIEQERRDPVIGFLCLCECTKVHRIARQFALTQDEWLPAPNAYGTASKYCAGSVTIASYDYLRGGMRVLNVKHQQAYLTQQQLNHSWHQNKCTGTA